MGTSNAAIEQNNRGKNESHNHVEWYRAMAAGVKQDVNVDGGCCCSRAARLPGPSTALLNLSDCLITDIFLVAFSSQLD